MTLTFLPSSCKICVVGTTVFLRTRSTSANFMSDLVEKTLEDVANNGEMD